MKKSIFRIIKDRIHFQFQRKYKVGSLIKIWSIADLGTRYKGRVATIREMKEGKYYLDIVGLEGNDDIHSASIYWDLHSNRNGANS